MQFDSFNLSVTNASSPDEIELRVIVPLKDRAIANVKVMLQAPTKTAQEGGADYKMAVNSSFYVTKTSPTSGGPTQLVSQDGLSWEIPVLYTGAVTVLPSHEPEVKDFLMKRFLPGHVFVDVGADVGAYSVRASEWEMKVYSFEPNPENIKALKRNLDINNLTLDIIQCALGSSEGKAYLSQNGAISRINASDGIEVPVRTLDSFNLQRVDLLKVDVEGYELEVFRGAIETLKRCHPAIVVEMHHWIGAEKEAAIFNILSSLNYKFKYLDRTSLGRHLSATYAPPITPHNPPTDVRA